MKANFTRTQNMRRKHVALGLVLCACLAAHVTGAQAYSQVQMSGSDGSNEGPKIFKALNMDLIYPRTFNASENVISTTQTPQLSATIAAPASLLGSHYAPPPPPQIRQQQRQHEQQQQQQSAILYVTPANDALPAVGAAAEAFGAVAASSGQENSEIAADDAPLSQVPASPLLTADDEQQQQQQQQQSADLQQQQELQQQEQSQEFASTGRAVAYRPSSAYNLNQLVTPWIEKSARPLRPPGGSAGRRPIYVRPAQAQSTSGIGKIIYPQAYQQQQRQPSRAEINKLRGKAPFSDRFTPGEAVAAGQFAKHHHNHDHDHQHNHKPSASKNNGNKLAASSNVVQTYTPPKHLYSFPPNINSKYPPPAQDPKAALPSSSINSYVAPPSGPLTSSSGYPLATASSNSNGYKYAGPVSSAYLPPDSGGDDTKSADAQKSPGNSADSDEGNDDTIGVLPASAMDPMGNDAKDAAGDSGGGDGDMDDMKGMDMAGGDGDDHPPPDDDKEYPTPPPGWVEEHPDSAHDHPHDDHPHDDHPPDHPIIHDHDHEHYFDHHFDFHDHFPSYTHYFHHHPEIIYDDHHDHHHIETPPPTLPPITTELPPEPAPEPRVKKYSYFYIGRKLWYIPLYFTVWFSFYVLWLILKSIARHKVNLPNHYVNRRSLPDSPDQQAQEYINQLTVAVLQKIDDYSRKQL